MNHFFPKTQTAVSGRHINRPLNGHISPEFQRSKGTPITPIRKHVKMKRTLTRKVLVVEGEFESMLNGVKHSVIVQVVCKDQEEAEAVLESRQHRYKNLTIKQITL